MHYSSHTPIWDSSAARNALLSSPCRFSSFVRFALSWDGTDLWRSGRDRKVYRGNVANSHNVNPKCLFVEGTYRNPSGGSFKKIIISWVSTNFFFLPQPVIWLQFMFSVTRFVERQTETPPSYSTQEPLQVLPLLSSDGLKTNLKI